MFPFTCRTNSLRRGQSRIFKRDRILATAEALARRLEGIERDLAEHQDIGAIIDALTDEERDQARRVVAKLKVALDEDEMRAVDPDQLN